MVRVLHLSSDHPDFQAERGMAAIAHADGGDFCIERRTIGRGGDWRGLLLAWIALRRGSHQADVIHAWDETALGAALAVPRTMILFSPSQLPGRRTLGRLRHIMRFRDVRLICASNIERDSAISAGIDAARCRIIAPATDGARPRADRDAQVRAKLGLDERDYVMLAPGESTRAAGHRESLWAGSILHVLDPTYKVLIWGRGESADSCRRLAEKLKQPTLLLFAEQALDRRMEYEEVVSAADVVVFEPRGPTPMLPMRIAMKAGLPIVATPTPWMEPELSKAANWFGVPRRSPRMVAQQVLKLRRGNVGRIAVAQSSGDIARFVECLRDLYRTTQ